MGDLWKMKTIKLYCVSNKELSDITIELCLNSLSYNIVSEEPYSVDLTSDTYLQKDYLEYDFTDFSTNCSLSKFELIFMNANQDVVARYTSYKMEEERL